MNKKVKAIALCRVSTMKQKEDGNLTPQKKNVEMAADVLDADLVKIWELVVSSRKGKNMNRKDLREMHDYCKRYRPVKYLIVDEVDRFMRSIDEYFWWKMEFKLIGVRLVHATRPDINPDDDRAVFDELIDVYRAEQSNNERIKKTPEKQKARLYAGYYPSNPHTGYKKSEIPGLHIPDEPNWSAMRTSFRAMAAGEYSVEEGLRQATGRGLRTKNYGPKAIGGKEIDMYRWKELMIDPYYCGIMKFADWDLGEQPIKGIHKPMITVEEHKILVHLVKNKGKRFTVKRNNPDYPFANQAECARCTLSEYKHPRLTGATQNNGAAKGYKQYKRYRCRACNLEVRQEVFHQEISEELSQLLLSYEQKDKLRQHARKIWSLHEKTRIEQAHIESNKLAILKERKKKILDSLIEAEDDLVKDLKERLGELRNDIAEAEKNTAEAQDFEKDFHEFIDFVFDFMDNLQSKWWKLDKQTMGIYKQMLFPAGIQLLPNKKVYIPKISPIYLYKNKKQPPKKADSSRLEGPLGLEPRTPCLKGRCSNQLSYGPVKRYFAQKTVTFLPHLCQ